MRDILFKAKRIDNGEWAEGNLVLTPKADEDFKAIIIPFDDNGEYTEGVNDDDLGFETWYKVDITTICQYTGLTDKNGNKIWENDVVNDSRGSFYKAFWQGRYYQFSWICVKSDLLPISAKWDLWSLSRDGDLEVAGNIFDNPELLEG